MKIINKLREIKKRFSRYSPLIEVLISKENLLHNFREFKNKYPKLEFAPVLKSNAYGHGLKETAEILSNEKKPFLAVDSLFEARALRNAGVSDRILIIGYFRPKEINYRLKKISYLVTSFEQLELLNKKIRRNTNIHLKIDTGMHRQGIDYSEAGKAIKIIKDNKKINLEGVCSHFADAENKNSEFTLKQIKKWNSIVDKFKKEFDSIKYFHLSATPGMRYSDKISANMVRLGIGLYGFKQGLGDDFNLKPVLSIKTIITSIRNFNAGDHIGYGITFQADKNMKTATIPFGYFEGLDRQLSNKGFVKVKDKFCPIIGQINMNITSLDVSNVPDVAVGDEVIVISDDPQDKNSVSKMAKLCNTIPYVILINIPSHLKRIISK